MLIFSVTTLFTLILACAAACIIPPESAWSEAPPALTLSFLLLFIILPTLSSTLALHLTHALRPRRLFLAKRFPLRAIPLALASALLALLLTTAIITFLPDTLPDVLATSLPHFLAVPLMLLSFTARARPNACPSCNYDLRALTPAAKGLCPECGRDLMPQQFRVQHAHRPKPVAQAPRLCGEHAR